MPIKFPWRIVISVGVSGLGLFLAFRGIDTTTLLKAICHAKLPWVITAAGFYGLAFIFRSLRWRLLLRPFGVLSIWRYFCALMFGFFVNEILPLRAGELARALLVARWLRIPVTVCLGTILSERLGDLACLLAVCATVSLNLPGAKLPTKSIALACALSAITIAALIRWGDTIRKVPFKTPWAQKGIKTLSRVIQGLQSIGNARQIAWWLATSMGVWLCDLFAMNTLAKAFGLSLSAIGTGALIVGIALGVMIPAAPGYIGTYEYFGRKTLELAGIPPQIALTYVVSLHFFQMIMIAVFGAPVLARVGIPRIIPEGAKGSRPGKPGWKNP